MLSIHLKEEFYINEATKVKLNFTANLMTVRRIIEDGDAREERRD